MTDIDIRAWADLEGLPGDLDELAGEAHQVFDYARTWVCQRAGFEPSPLCLLSPLADLMDVFAQGFDEVERLAVQDWASIRSAVVAATADLRSADDRVAEQMPEVA
ncbi:hypothetical protein [Nocardioides sp. MH1]|uniref:hypothetical protein n=1 Tax=Nocardioides sp. MH1 TaxID=3242490 RepID=UPI0035211533